jgi:D-alanyl-D-alanine endopeptidase (penicillin-binding protein 7)
MLTMPKFRVSLLSLTLLLAVPFAPQALAKTPVAVTACSRKLLPAAR